MKHYRVTSLDDPNYSFTDFTDQSHCTPYNAALTEMRTMPNAELTVVRREMRDDGFHELERLIADRINGRDRIYASHQKRMTI